MSYYAFTCLGVTRIPSRLLSFRRPLSTTSKKPRPISAIELPNFRDLASASPDKVHQGKVYRSASPSTIKHEAVHKTSVDTQKFLHSVSAYVDLRSRQERALDNSDVLEVLCGEDYWWRWKVVPILNRRRLLKGLMRTLPPYQVFEMFSQPMTLKSQLVQRIDEGGLVKLNRILLDTGRKGVRKAMEVVTENVLGRNGPALIFCSAGKDRTGLIAALVLATAGVSETEIIADYVSSNQTWLNGDFDLRREYSGK